MPTQRLTRLAALRDAVRRQPVLIDLRWFGDVHRLGIDMKIDFPPVGPGSQSVRSVTFQNILKLNHSLEKARKRDEATLSNKLPGTGVLGVVAC